MSIGLATDGYYGSGGGEGDQDPPTITAVSPTPGAAPGDPDAFSEDISVAVQTPIVVDIDDVFPGVRYAAVTNETDGEVTVFRASNFLGEYVARSSLMPLSDGFELSILPDGGWATNPDPTQPTFIKLTIDAVDQAGNLASATFVYELPAGVPAPIAPAPARAAGVDHVAEALGRLPQQFRK